MSDNCRGFGAGSVFLAFLMGAAIGGGLALLAAPRSGRETRDRIRGAADELGDRVKATTDDAEARIREAVDEGRELLKEKADILKTALDAGREAMEAERAKHQKEA